MASRTAPRQLVALLLSLLSVLTLACTSTPDTLAGNTWRVERVFSRSHRHPVGSSVTREIGADSALQIRLEMGAASGTRVPGTLVFQVPHDRTVMTYEVTATESATGEVTVSVPGGISDLRKFTASGSRRGDELWLFGTGKADVMFVDSILLRRVRKGQAPGGPLVIVERGDLTAVIQAQIANMKSDLRNLVTAQEAYFADNVRYTRRLSDLNFVPSFGVTIEMRLTADGWWGRARNTTGVECEIFVGSSTGGSLARREGAPACSGEP